MRPGRAVRARAGASSTRRLSRSTSRRAWSSWHRDVASTRESETYRTCPSPMRRSTVSLRLGCSTTSLTSTGLLRAHARPSTRRSPRRSDECLDHLRELRALGGFPNPESAFSGENGTELLRRHFAPVDELDARGTIRFPDREAVVSYPRASITLKGVEERLPDFQPPFIVRRHPTIFVAEKAGGQASA